MTEKRIIIDDTVGQTKLQQLVHSISESIANGTLKNGDMLPSVNQLSSETGFSRDTVFKAYSILKQRNLIESAPTKGYFVAGDSFKVMMLLDDFSAFKEQLYQSFRQNLPDSYAVDLLFHHYNKELFTQLIENSLGRYSMYVVMNIDETTIHPVLQKIDPNKLLILDMGTPEDGRMNYLLQDFGQSLVNCLEQGADRLKKYSGMVLVYDEKSTPHPSAILPAVQGFCAKHSLEFKRISQIKPNEIASNTVYFVVRDSDLVTVIKTCRSKNLELGKEVGVLSYNDTPMKQIVGGGISVISTDFEEMGRETAEFVKNKQKIAKILKTSLILRDSM